MMSLIVPLIAATVVAAGAGLLFGMQVSDLVAKKPDAAPAAEAGKAKDAHGAPSKDSHGAPAKDAHGGDATPKPAKPTDLTVVSRAPQARN
jgi:hypothetical protein